MNDDTSSAADHAARSAGEMPRRLRSALDSRGWSAETLAERSGVHWTAVYRYLAGSQVPRADTLARLAAALGVDVGTLLAD